MYVSTDNYGRKYIEEYTYIHTYIPYERWIKGSHKLDI